MQTRRTLLASVATMISLSVAGPAAVSAKEPIPVVATFSILGDMVARIGGDHVALTTLVGAGGDTHVYRPTPAAARAVSAAKVLFVNGLEFEGWLDRLAEAAEFEGTIAVATAGVAAIAFDDDHDEHEDHDEHGHDDHDGEKHDDHADDKHDDGHDDHADDEHDDEKHDDKHGDHDADHDDDHAAHDHDDHEDHDKEAHDDHEGDDHEGDEHAGHDHGAYDPHAWQSIANALTYADNIAAALATVDPDNASEFYRNRAAYAAELEALDAEVRAMIELVPENRRTIVTSHDAFQYFGRDYGLKFVAPQGLSTESDPSAADVAAMITQIREEGISAVFVESITDNRLLEQIASETGAAIGGTLYPGSLSGPDGPAPSYIDMMRHNATTIARALGS